MGSRRGDLRLGDQPAARSPANRVPSACLCPDSESRSPRPTARRCPPRGNRGSGDQRTERDGRLSRKTEETAKTIVDGRLHTGDVGYLDDDGYLVLVDRIKDMIIRGGENLYPPKEIETALYHHEDVLEAAVIGKPDPIYGEVPVAYVSLRPGSTLTSDDLFDVCRKSLSKFKLPVDIIIRDDLPKNSVGKLHKPALRAEHRSATSASAS